MMTHRQKKDTLKLLRKLWTVKQIAYRFRLEEDEVQEFVTRLTPATIGQIEKAASQKLIGVMENSKNRTGAQRTPDKPKCPAHLKRLNDLWRAKHGDQLVVGYTQVAR